ASGRLSSLSLAGLDLLLARDGALGSAAAARVGARPLAAHGQPAAMAPSAVRADLGHPLDVRGHLAAQVALDEDLLGGGHPVDDLAQARDPPVPEVLRPRV